MYPALEAPFQLLLLETFPYHASREEIYMCGLQFFFREHIFQSPFYFLYIKIATIIFLQKVQKNAIQTKHAKQFFFLFGGDSNLMGSLKVELKNSQ